MSLWSRTVLDVKGVVRTLTRSRKPKFRGFITVPIDATEYLKSIRWPIYREIYEDAEVTAVAAIVRPDDRVLELGAGCGIVSAVAASRLKSSSTQMLSYEANSDLAPSFKATMAANGLAPVLCNAAIGRNEGSAEFFVKQDFLSSSALDRGRVTAKRTVPVHSFLAVVNQFKPSVVLMDLEGAETEIFADPLPDFVRAVSGEFHPHITGDAAVTKIAQALFSQGFMLKIDLSKGRVLSFERDIAALE